MLSTQVISRRQKDKKGYEISENEKCMCKAVLSLSFSSAGKGQFLTGIF